MPIFVIAQCESVTFGILKAEVHGDTAILKNDTAYRNCGVHYIMDISSLSADTLVWKQVDYGVEFGCDCHFNLSVTIDSLKPGNYTAMTYYTDSRWRQAKKDSLTKKVIYASTF